MSPEEQQEQVLELLTRWAEQEPLVRAAILTSSRAIPHAHKDAFSDYDVIVVLTNIGPMYKDLSLIHI